MHVYIVNGFMTASKCSLVLLILYLCPVWANAGYILLPHASSAAVWFEKGRAEAKSKLALGYFQKVIDITKNSSKAGDKILLADAYYFKGYHYYYYQYDFTAIQSGTGDQTDPPYDEESTKDLIAEGEEMAKMTDDERRATAKDYYRSALNVNENHADALYETGVYYFWRAAYFDVKKQYSTAISNYRTAFSYFNSSIINDKKCSTAYEFRGRIYWRAGNMSRRDRDFAYCNKLRQNPNEPYYEVPRLFEHSNYSGSVLEASSNSSWIGDWWNDRITGYKVPYFWAITMYQHSQYGGASLTRYGEANDSTLTDNAMNSDTSWNDEISSYKVWLYRTGYGQALSLGTFARTPQSSFTTAFLTSEY